MTSCTLLSQDLSAAKLWLASSLTVTRNHLWWQRWWRSWCRTTRCQDTTGRQATMMATVMIVCGGTVSVALQSNCLGRIREHSSRLGEFLSRSIYEILHTTRKGLAIFWGSRNWRVVIWQQNKVSSRRSKRHKGEDIWTNRETGK